MPDWISKSASATGKIQRGAFCEKVRIEQRTLNFWRSDQERARCKPVRTFEQTLQSQFRTLIALSPGEGSLVLNLKAPQWQLPLYSVFSVSDSMMVLIKDLEDVFVEGGRREVNIHTA